MVIINTDQMMAHKEPFFIYNIAKSLGLKVYTSGNGSSEERVKNLGADVFIDYKKEDYINIIKDVDYVIDSIGEKELLKEFRILKNGGKLVSL